MALDVASMQAFDEAIKDAQHAVAYFWAAWSEPCKQMDVVVQELAKKCPGVAFVRIEAEKVDDLTERFGIETVPCCIILEGGKKAGAVEGFDPAALTQRATALAASAPARAAAAAAATAPRLAGVEGRIQGLLASAPLILFMKGSKQQPYCGFSSRVVDALKAAGHEFETFDILQDEEIRQGLKAWSNWPTFPQLYLNGELVGGCDIVTEMAASGELQQVLDGALGPARKGQQQQQQHQQPQPAAAAPRAAAPAAAAPAAGGADAGLQAQLEQLVKQKPIMLFMKGNPDAPRCGFSRKVVEALQGDGLEFGTFDILQDEAVRQGLKEFSHWPTYPQLYVNGELLGGCDIILEMKAAGELKGSVEEMLHRTT